MDDDRPHSYPSTSLLLAELSALGEMAELPSAARTRVSVILQALRGEGGAAATEAGTGLGTLPTREESAAAPFEAAPHLAVLERIGAGGMGEVWLARDLRLDCLVALKVIHRRLSALPALKERFLREARLTAGLQHPGIVPVHEIGDLADGRPWYTMKRVEGLPFSELLARPAGLDPMATLRARVQVLHRVAQAIAYAHGRSVLHRDLKPDNIRVGALGEVIVLDWGLARTLDEAEPGLGLSQLTQGPMGTPGYMAPEQQSGETVGAPADVYALGRILRQILERTGPVSGAEVLHDLAARACASEPGQRFPDATPFAEEVGRWLDGARRRERALHLVEEANQLSLQVDALRARASVLRSQARAEAGDLSTWAPESEKQSSWQHEDEARHLDREARLLEVRRLQVLNACFTHVPDLPEARSRLARHYRALHAQAEASGDEDAAAEWELLLGAHDDGQHADWLRGEGWLSIETGPVGARVRLFRDLSPNRRSVLEELGPIGPAPIHRLALPRGRYRLRIEAEGHAPCWHPVLIRRMEHEDNIPPAEDRPRPLRLPLASELGPDDVFISPGWTITGADPGAANAAPSGRIWVEGFVMRRFPVTNAEYLVFLDALVEQGRTEEALAHAPRERVAVEGAQGRLLVAFDGRRFTLQTDAEGHAWRLDWPVLMIDHAAALAYAAWESQRSGLPGDQAWRLPREDEWERAARGADGRVFPWGDLLDPTWACYRSSHPDGRQITPWPVGACPVDESPFGVRDLGGGVRDWCENLWGGDVELLRRCPVLRGGAWNSHPQLVRAATRGWADARDRNQNVGFRLVRSL